MRRYWLIMGPLVLFVAYGNLSQVVLAFGFCAGLRILLILLRYEQGGTRYAFFRLLLFLLGPTENSEYETTAP